MTDRERYLAAVHAMQTGVAFAQNYGSADGTPKHLRVGVNVALRDMASLALLLVNKGIITMEEYDKALADGMEQEARRYEALMAEQHGINVRFA